MKLEIHIHNHYYDNESLALIKKIYVGLKEGTFTMALSPEMQAFVDASTAAFTAAGESLANISADVQRLVDGSASSLSQEDKDALTAVTTQLVTLKDNLATAAAVVPES